MTLIARSCFVCGGCSGMMKVDSSTFYPQERQVIVIGGGLDKSPRAYKPIASIIAAQSDLVELVGKFTPRIVRMADEPGAV